MGPQTNVAMMRLMMGQKISDLLEVPAIEQGKIDRLGQRIKRIARVMEILDHSLVFAMLLQLFTRYFSRFMVHHMTRSKIITFYIPKSLKLDWGAAPAKTER